MHITGIEVTELQHTAASDIGLVALTTSRDTIQMRCVIPRAKQGGWKQALIADALRQLTRMPEFRSGEKTLRLAPGLAQADPAAA